MFQKKQRRPIVPIGYLSGMRVISVPENLASVVKQTFSDEQRRPLVPSGYLSGLRVISVPEKPAGVVQQRCQTSDWGQTHYVGHLSQVPISADCVPLKFLKNRQVWFNNVVRRAIGDNRPT